MRSDSGHDPLAIADRTRARRWRFSGWADGYPADDSGPMYSEFLGGCPPLEILSRLGSKISQASAEDCHPPRSRIRPKTGSPDEAPAIDCTALPTTTHNVTLAATLADVRWSAICTLILCSCRGPAYPPLRSDRSPVWAAVRSAFTGAPPAMGTPVAGETAHGGDHAGHRSAARSGLRRFRAGRATRRSGVPGYRREYGEPWPEDEYLLDGGDRNACRPTCRTELGEFAVWSRKIRWPTSTPWTDETMVTAKSNRVRIYSPAIRCRPPGGQHRPETSNGTMPGRAMSHLPTSTGPLQRRTTLNAQSKQNLQLNRQIGARSWPASSTAPNCSKGVMSTAVGPHWPSRMPSNAYENVQVIRERTRSRNRKWPSSGPGGVDAAVTWSSHKQAVQIILDQPRGHGRRRRERYRDAWNRSTPSKSPPGNPRLRVIKVASTQFAEPGDTVDFTLRFDNVGNEPIGNVTVIDNLTTRLEFMPESTAQCSLRGEVLSPKQNEVGSQVAGPTVGNQRSRCRSPTKAASSASAAACGRK